jgi:succinate dehydrogenase/fumarate reductase flavoprotein subunit
VVAQDTRQFGDFVETDVLIIGGGLAGNHAAIGAAETGARVLIADKGFLERYVGRGTCDAHYSLNVIFFDPEKKKAGDPMSG